MKEVLQMWSLEYNLRLNISLSMSVRNKIVQIRAKNERTHSLDPKSQDY